MAIGDVLDPGCDTNPMAHAAPSWIEVNAGAGWVDVDARCTAQALIDATRPFRAMPAVLPVARGLTVAEAIDGVGVGSSAFRHGCMRDTVLAIELEGPDGQALHCTPGNEHASLFRAFMQSSGSLGRVLRLRLRLAPFKRHVRVEHRRYDSVAGLLDDLPRQSAGDADFVDALARAGRAPVLSTATLVDPAPWLGGERSLRTDLMAMAERRLDYQDTTEYLWRWDPQQLRRAMGGSGPRAALRRWMRHMADDRPGLVWRELCLSVSEAEDCLAMLMAAAHVSTVRICPVRVGAEPGARVMQASRAPGLRVHLGFWQAMAAIAPQAGWVRAPWVQPRSGPLDQHL